MAEEKLLKDLERLKKQPYGSAEASVLRNYLDTVLELPWNKFTKERIDVSAARKILDKIYFYPPAQHAYQCSICGRSCDMACYVHLEEKGVLTKKFKTPFRKREEWKFDIEDWK